MSYVALPGAQVRDAAARGISVLEEKRQELRNEMALDALRRRSTGWFGWLWQRLYGTPTIERMHQLLADGGQFNNYNVVEFRWGAQSEHLEGLERQGEIAAMRGEQVSLAARDARELMKWGLSAKPGDHVLTS